MIPVKTAVSEEQTYPTVTIVTNAHQTPSREPRKNSCENCSLFVWESYGLEKKQKEFNRFFLHCWAELFSEATTAAATKTSH